MNNSPAFRCLNLVSQFSYSYISKRFLKNRFYLVYVNSYHSSSVFQQIKPKSQSTLNIFDRKTKKLQRERATLLDKPENYDYLKKEVGYRLADRIYDIKRTFEKVIDLGCGRGFVSKHVTGDYVKELIMTDHSELLMAHCKCDDPSVKTEKTICDEEHLLDVFQPDSVDLVISNLVLHWVNQLPGCFEQVLKILKVDGVFLGSMFGCDTLFELRSSLQLAELERKGGVSPHISPFARPTDVGGLLGRAGFTMQTIDVDELVIRYPSMFELMEDLKGMGESNAAWSRSLHLSRDILVAASVIYQKLYAHTKTEGNDIEGVPATFQIINFIAWKPHPNVPQSQPKDAVMFSIRDFDKDFALNDEISKKDFRNEAYEFCFPEALHYQLGH